MISTKFNIMGINLNPLKPNPDTDFIFKEMSDGTYAIQQQSWTIPSGDVVLPSTYNGKPVSQVMSSGFNRSSQDQLDSTLKSIYLPESIKIIGGGAFKGNAGLISMKIPSGVTQIWANTFYSCINLTSLIIPSSVTYISGNAFYKCQSLTSLIIPSSVTAIQRNAFSGCSKLNDFTMEGKDKATVQAMANYPWGLDLKVTTIHCKDGDITPGPTAKSYVQNGLVLQLDGIENDGYGNHNPNISQWKSLVGSSVYNIKPEHMNVIDNGLNFPAINSLNGNPYTIDNFDADFSNGITIEFIGKPEEVSEEMCPLFEINPPGSVIILNKPGQSANFTASKFADKLPNKQLVNKPIFGSKNIIVYRSKLDNNSIDIKYNNLNQELKYGNKVQGANLLNVLGSRSEVGNSVGLKGDIYAFRVYNRVLTDEELKQNYDIDVERFNLVRTAQVQSLQAKPMLQAVRPMPNDLSVSDYNTLSSYEDSSLSAQM